MADVPLAALQVQGPQVAQNQINPFQAAEQMMRTQQIANENRLFNLKLQGMQGISEILSKSGTLDEGLATAARSPYAPFVSDYLKTMTDINSNLANVERTRTETGAKQQDIINGSLHGFMLHAAPLYGAIMRGASDEEMEQIGANALAQTLPTVPDAQQPKVKQAIGAWFNSILSNVPGNLQGTDRVNFLRDRFLQSMTGAGMTKDDIDNLVVGTPGQIDLPQGVIPTVRAPGGRIQVVGPMMPKGTAPGPVPSGDVPAPGMAPGVYVDPGGNVVAPNTPGARLVPGTGVVTPAPAIPEPSGATSVPSTAPTPPPTPEGQLGPSPSPAFAPGASSTPSSPSPSPPPPASPAEPGGLSLPQVPDAVRQLYDPTLSAPTPSDVGPGPQGSVEPEVGSTEDQLVDASGQPIGPTPGLVPAAQVTRTPEAGTMVMPPGGPISRALQGQMTPPGLPPGSGPMPSTDATAAGTFTAPAAGAPAADEPLPSGQTTVAPGASTGAVPGMSYRIVSPDNMRAGDGRALTGDRADWTPYLPPFQSNVRTYGGDLRKTPDEEGRAKDRNDHFAGDEAREFEGNQKAQMQLALISRDLDILAGTPLEPGATGPGALEAAKAYQSLINVTKALGLDTSKTGLPSEAPKVVTPEMIAAAEQLVKSGRLLQYATVTTNFGAQREAAQTISQAAQAVPGMANTLMGNRLLVASLWYAAQRGIDYRNFMTAWRADPRNRGDLTGGDVAFNALHPATGYADQMLRDFGMNREGFSDMGSALKALQNGWIGRDVFKQTQDRLIGPPPKGPEPTPQGGMGTPPALPPMRFTGPEPVPQGGAGNPPNPLAPRIQTIRPQSGVPVGNLLGGFR